jgi:hypothetical protein
LWSESLLKNIFGVMTMLKIVSKIPEKQYIEESDVTETSLYDGKVIAFYYNHKIHVLCRVGMELYQWCELGSECYWGDPKKSFEVALKSNCNDFDTYVFENRNEFFMWALEQST